MGVIDALNALRAGQTGGEMTFLPGASPATLDALEAQFGAKLPADYRELALACAGIEGGVFEIDFTTKDMDVDASDLSPHAIPFAADGIGNFWIVDVRKGVDELSHVFYLCHDAPVFLFQCVGMEAFLQSLAKHERNDVGPIEQVMNDSLFNVWEKDPKGISQQDALASSDAKVREFAQTLNPSFLIADLRNPEPGMGFAWGRFGPDTILKRFGEERIFAYGKPEKKPGLLGRLFGRK